MIDIPFGAIVLTDFPFTDLRSTKRRPALVVSTGNGRRMDVVLAYITSVAGPFPDGAAIAPLPGTGLKVSSIVRFDKLATVDKGIIVGRLGTAPTAWLVAHRARFCQVFGFGIPEGVR